MRAEHIGYVRCAALMLSFATMVLSMGLILFGLRSVVETSHFSEIIGTRELTTIALMLLSIGICTFAATPLGLFSVINKQNTAMLTYMVVTFFACLFSALCAWLGLNLSNEVEGGVILQWMNTSFLKEYGNPEAITLTQSWDNMQRRFACCGVSDERNSSEWLSTHWFISYETWPRPRVPTSCCSTCEAIHSKFCDSMMSEFPEDEMLTEDQKTCIAASYTCSEANASFVDVDVCQGRASPAAPKQTYMHTRGCYKPLIAMLHYYINCIVYASLLMFATTLLSTCIWFALLEIYSSSQDYGDVLLPHNLLLNFPLTVTLTSSGCLLDSKNLGSGSFSFTTLTTCRFLRSLYISPTTAALSNK